MNYKGKKMISFNPLIPYLLAGEMGCGLDNPFTYNFLLLKRHPLQNKFSVNTEQLIKCMENDSQLSIVIDKEFDNIADQNLRNYTAKLNKNRVIVVKQE
jgi:hypothetical protein